MIYTYFSNILIIHGRDIFVDSCIRRFLVQRKGSLIFILWWTWLSNHWKLIIIPGLIISIDIVQRNHLDEWHDVLCSLCSFLILGVYMHLHKDQYCFHVRFIQIGTKSHDLKLFTLFIFYLTSQSLLLYHVCLNVWLKLIRILNFNYRSVSNNFNKLTFSLNLFFL